MTKKDLKSGMTVKLRSGDVGLVINDFITNNIYFMYFTDYDDNLVCRDEYTDLDIIEVYQWTNLVTKVHVSNLKTLLDLTNPNMKLLWKRQELPKLSSAERVILQNLDKQYKWIARDKSGHLFAFDSEPSKRHNVWVHCDYELTTLDFPNLFTFVKWEDEQPYIIEELLKGEKKDEQLERHWKTY